MDVKSILLYCGLVLGINSLAFADEFGEKKNSNSFSFKIEGGYIKFQNKGSKEFKNKFKTKIEAKIKHNNLYIKIGDIYQKIRRNKLNYTTNGSLIISGDTVIIPKKQPTPIDLRKATVSSHLLYAKVSSHLEKVDVSAGVMLSVGNSGLPRARVINAEVRTKKYIVLSPLSNIDFGLFAQYGNFKRNSSDGKYKSYIVQLTPKVYFTYRENIKGKVYVDFIVVNSNYRYHDKTFVDGGFDLVGRINDKLDINAGIRIGESLYRGNGEDLDIIPRISNMKFYLGLIMNVNKQVALKLMGTYDQYKVIDVEKSQKAGEIKRSYQGGLGLSAGADIKF